MRSLILTINRGSATLKANLYDVQQRDQIVLSIKSTMEPKGSELRISDACGTELLHRRIEIKNEGEDLLSAIQWLIENGCLDNLQAVGHRIVHGGPNYAEPVLIDSRVIRDFESMYTLDPEHLPKAVQAIQLISKQLPNVPQVACFDTTFHQSLPKMARMYAIPRKFFDQGIQRFGFHGISYEFVMSEIAQLDKSISKGRIIIAHLGSGASMVAVKHGHSVDTSMGFTPLEGLVMGTRSGDLDPGILQHLLGHYHLFPKDLTELLNKQSGLLGISAHTSDMHELLELAPHNTFAAEAIDAFCYRAKKYLGAYVAILGGLDLLVFTGGIGENACTIRKKICTGLEFLGIHLDNSRNESNSPIISTIESPAKVRVIQTDEDLMIVRHVKALLGPKLT